MNKYRDKSDFEINKAVFRAARIKHKWFRFLPHGVVTYNIKGDWVIFDPCKNPTDAMPIVIRSLISLISDKSDDGESAWWVAQDVTGSIASGLKSNPYRAAMEVFLMMKDAENEK